jgi:hypothetical protein
MRPGSFENLTANRRLLLKLTGISEFDKPFDPYSAIILPEVTKDWWFISTSFNPD